MTTTRTEICRLMHQDSNKRHANGYKTFWNFQARQILEREFNNLLALGTDRRLDEVGM